MRNRITKRMLVATLAFVCAAFIQSGCGSDQKETDSLGGDSTPTAQSGSSDDLSAGSTETADDSGDSNATSDDSQPTSTTPEPSPIQILGGDFSGVHVDEATIIIARSNREYNALKRRHFSHGVKQKGGGVIGADFKSRQMVGLFLPPQKPGVVVQILSVEESDGKIIVGATKMLGGKGCKFPAGKVRPFHIVETRKMQGKPTLKLEVLRASDC